MLSQGYHPFITSHFYRTLNLSSLHIREPLQDCLYRFIREAFLDVGSGMYDLSLGHSVECELGRAKSGSRKQTNKKTNAVV